MSENKRYYWLKLMDDFFDSKRIKKLRKMAGGDTFTIIYLKMQLLSLQKGGYLEYSGLEDEFYKEIALDIDEDEVNVQVTIQYLLSCGLLETTDNIEYLLPFAKHNLGSETASTRRSRKYRENAQKMLQCNSNKKDFQCEDRKKTRSVERYEEFSKSYPKMCTGFLAETEYCNAVLAGVPENDLVQAAQNYADVCRRNKTAERYIKKPENFLRENLFMQYLKGEGNGSAGRNTGSNEKSLGELMQECGDTGEFQGF